MGVTARHTGVDGHGRATISLQEALASGEPVTMANYASYMMGYVRDGRLWDKANGRAFPDLAHFVDRLMDSPGSDAAALLHCIATLTADEALAQYIRAELSTRDAVLPTSVTRLGELHIARAWVKPDPDGLGDQWVL